jgi:hypothetical protein
MAEGDALNDPPTANLDKRAPEAPVDSAPDAPPTATGGGTHSTTPLGVEDDQANSAVNANVQGVDKVGVFTSPQTLVTFAGATAAVTTISSVLDRVGLIPDKYALIVPFVVSLLVGAVIYLVSVQKGEGAQARLMGLSVAVVNSFMIAAAVLGVEMAGNRITGTPPKGYVEAVSTTDKEALQRQAEARLNGRDYPGAVASYSELIGLEPKNSWHYKDRGNAYNHLPGDDNNKKAIEDYDYALTLIGDTESENAVEQKLELYLDRGMAYLDLGDKENARSSFESVCTVDAQSEECAAAHKELSNL